MPVNVGTLLVDVRFNTGDLGRRLEGELGRAGEGAGKAIDQSLSGRLTRLGTTLGNTGRQLTLGLTLPLVAFGRQAVNAFVGFDRAMTQVSALVGVNRDLVNVWRGEVKGVGTQYGIAATDAAQALYFITSSGVEAADAMGVLDISAKASAVGLGTIQQTADIVTSAINAYGKENMTAAKAADVLTVAVREGKGEADKLGGALSAVIPIASSLKIGFGEVAGAMSAMTLSGTTPDEAATQLRGILNTLQDMPPIAQRALKAYTGLDYATLRANLSSKGLVPTLKQITDAFKGNEAATAEVFGNVRALTGVYNLFGEKEQQTLNIVRQTTAAQGDLNKAFDETAQSAAFKLTKARAAIDAALTDIGAVVVPVFAKAAEATAYFVGSLASLGPVAGTAVAGFGALVASAGPLLFVFGSMSRLTGNALTAIKFLDVVATKAALNLVLSGGQMAAAFGEFALKARAAALVLAGPLAAGAASAVVTLALVNHEINKFDSEWEKIRAKSTEKTAAASSFEELERRLAAANKIIGETQASLDFLNANSDIGWNLGLVAEIHDLNQAGESAQKTAEEVGRLVQLSNALAQRYGLSKGAALGFVQAQDAANHKAASGAEAIDLYAQALRDNDPLVQKAVEETAKQADTFSGLIAKVKDTSDAFFAVNAATKAWEDAKANIAEANKKVIDSERDFVTAQRNTETATRRQADADRRLTDSGKKLADARTAAADAQKALSDALAGPSEDERLNVDSAELSLKEARARAREAKDPLDRQRARLDVRRAELELERARGANAERVAQARSDLSSATEAVASAEQAQLEALQGVADALVAYNDAKAKEAEAQDAIAKAKQGVADAEAAAVTPAMNLASAQATLGTMFETGTAKGEDFRKFLIKLKELYPEVGGTLDGLLKKYEALQLAATTAPPQGNMPAGMQSERAIEGRATGGPTYPGHMYQVNEQNVPELYAQGGRQYLIPLATGEVTPLADIPVRGGDGGFNVGDINVYETSGRPRQTAYEVRRELRKESYLSGRRP